MSGFPLTKKFITKLTMKPLHLEILKIFKVTRLMQITSHKQYMRSLLSYLENKYSGDEEVYQLLNSIIKFSSRYGICLNESTAEFEQPNFNKYRIILVIVFKLATLLTSIRYLLTALINNETIAYLFADNLHLFFSSADISDTAVRLARYDCVLKINK